MRFVLTKYVPAAVLLIAGWPAQADDVPELNVDPVCRGIAQQAKDPGERGGPIWRLLSASRANKPCGRS
jgi:hypothetical protein